MIVFLRIFFFRSFRSAALVEILQKIFALKVILLEKWIRALKLEKAQMLNAKSASNANGSINPLSFHQELQQLIHTYFFFDVKL